MKRLFLISCLAGIASAQSDYNIVLEPGKPVTITVMVAAPTPSPTATPTPTPPITPTPSPTPTATPTPSPTPTASPPTPTPTPTPTATPAPSPSTTPTPSASPSPSGTPSPPGLPAAPSALKATATGCQQISLGWTDNSTNEDGFKIDRSPDGKAWTGVGRVSPDQTNYVDNLANPAQVRYYRVYAFNGQGNSAYSNSASADTGPLCGSPTPSPTPAQVTVTVSWVNTAGHTYKLYYGNTASGQYQYSVPAGAGPNYVLSGLTPLTTYYFALTAIASGVESGKSPEVVYTTTAQAQQLLKLP